MHQHTYRFLDYELNVESRCLKRRGTRIAIRPKTLATLCYLIENRHRLVTKDDLLDAIWAGVDVQDQAVFQSVSELRSIFAGEACIETVRGRGYRWAIPLRSQQSPSTSTWSRSRAAFVAGVSAIAAIVVIALPERQAPSILVVINPISSSSLLPVSEETAPGISQMLMQQLRQMGWDSRAGDSQASPADAFEVDIDLETAESGLALRWTISKGELEDSGQVVSDTPLGAVRDLAAGIHKSLRLRTEANSKALEIADMVEQARQHIDAENYDLAKSYLDVVLAEQPEHLSARMALAATYLRRQQHQQALDAGLMAHDAALRTGQDADRMVNAILLSRVLSKMYRYTESEKFAREALELGSSINDLLAIAEAQEQLGEISLATGDVTLGRERLTVALQYYSTFCPMGEARVVQRLTELGLPEPDKVPPTAKPAVVESS